MTEHLSPELGVAHQFIQLITPRWSEVGDDLSMELRALGRRLPDGALCRAGCAWREV